eukprot:TRINITY_DN1474_c0_g1_i2.p1 TRINITY_DN1474_c0_g1~~TRINITY_DN1474_c0_g1_i2.p1  ORF type:complete len:162 (-),score=32.33 TRINITY_DN1474_c0_g1_i2:212-697(-)
MDGILIYRDLWELIFDPNIVVPGKKRVFNRESSRECVLFEVDLESCNVTIKKGDKQMENMYILVDLISPIRVPLTVAFSRGIFYGLELGTLGEMLKEKDIEMKKYKKKQDKKIHRQDKKIRTLEKKIRTLEKKIHSQDTIRETAYFSDSDERPKKRKRGKK